MKPALSEPLDLLISGVIPLEGTSPTPSGETASIGIRGKHIVWVGDTPIEGVTAHRHLHLPGHLVCPGFINMHYHAGLNFVRGVGPDLGFAPSYTRGIPQASDLTAEEAGLLSGLGSIEALKAGSTTLVDSFVHGEQIVPHLASTGARIFASPRLNDVDFASVLAGQRRFDPGLAKDMLASAKEIIHRWHNSHAGRVRVHLTAHAPDTCSESFLLAIAALAAQHQIKLSTHLAQSLQEVDWVRQQYGCSPVALLQRLGLLNQDLLAGHCIHVDNADIDLLGASGAAIVHIPLGNAVSGRFAPTHRLREAGCLLTLATDTMHGDMIEAMRWALAVGRIQEGCVSTAWQPADVLSMATRNAARALGMGAELGEIRAGQLADLVLINLRRPHLTPAVNPLGTLIHNGTGCDVDHVVVDGRLVVEAGRCTLIDEEQVMKEARRVTQHLWKRHGKTLIEF